MKYAHGFVLFLLWFLHQFLWIHVKNLPIFHTVASLTPVDSARVISNSAKAYKPFHFAKFEQKERNVSRCKIALDHARNE